MTNRRLEEYTDGELISHYVQHRSDSEAAMRVLLGRYKDSMYKRILVGVHNKDDAHDLEQELWSKVARSLHRYQDEGKFEHYLSRIKSNVLTDYYRKVGKTKEVFVEEPANFGEDDATPMVESFEDTSQNIEHHASNVELIQHLTTVLIPALPVEQRAAWLLRHESEYWEATKPFTWAHIAELNGMSDADVASMFATARDKLLIGATNGQVTELEELELLIFVVWTQAQRYEKSKNFTWEYFAEILGQPVNTMKTRYRSAQKTLDKGLREFMES